MNMPIYCMAICTATRSPTFNRVNDIAYNTYEGFVQDSWKVSRRLTLELGHPLHPLPALDRPRRATVIRSSIPRNTIPVARRIQYCGFRMALAAIVRCRWADFRLARCSFSRGSAAHTI